MFYVSLIITIIGLFITLANLIQVLYRCDAYSRLLEGIEANAEHELYEPKQ